MLLPRGDLYTTFCIVIVFVRLSVIFQCHTGWQIDLDLIWDYKAGGSYQVYQICLDATRVTGIADGAHWRIYTMGSLSADILGKNEICEDETPKLLGYLPIAAN